MPTRKPPEPTVYLVNADGDRLRCPISGVAAWEPKGYRPVGEDEAPRVAKEAQEAQAESINWARMTVLQLRGIAKDAAIPKHTSMSKAELIDAIIERGVEVDIEFVT